MKPYLRDHMTTLWVGDALDILPTLPAGSIDCCVTSPPYADARRDYLHVGPALYPEWLTKVACEIRRVLKPAGSMLLNLGRLMRDGEELDYAEESVRLMRADGWKRIDTIVWSKSNANGTGGPYLHNMHEYVYWLAPSVDAYRGYDDTRQPYAAETLARYNRISTQAVKGEPRVERGRDPHPLGAKPKSVVTFSVGKEKGNPHPAPMPAELAELLVKLGCPRGGTVLDPFAGGGTTLRAARDHGRRSVGIEISEEYAAMSFDRLSQLPLLEAL